MALGRRCEKFGKGPPRRGSNAQLALERFRQCRWPFQFIDMGVVYFFHHLCGPMRYNEAGTFG